MPDRSSHLYFFSNHRRAQLAVISLGVAALGSVLASVSLIGALNVVQRTFGALAAQQLEAIAAFQLLAYLVTGVLYLRWIYHAYQNHQALQPAQAEYSPNWAVWGFIIPIINLFRPYQVVDEMWRVLPRPIELAPPQRLRRALRQIVLLWWITFLTPQILDRLVSTWSIRAGNSSANALLLISLLSEALLFVSAVLAIHIIQTIEVGHEVAARDFNPQASWPVMPRWRPWLYVISLGIVVTAALLIWKEPPAPRSIETADAPPPIPTMRPSVYGTRATARSGLTSTRTPIPTLRPVVYATLDATRAAMATPTKSPTATPTPTPTLNPEAREGLQYYKDGKFALALIQFDQSLRYDTQNARTYYYRGLTHNALDNPAKAMKDFDQALKLDPHLIGALIDRGWLHVSDHNYGKALIDFERAITVDKKNAAGYAGRGYAYYMLKEHKLALADANTTIDQNDTYPDGFYLRGLVYHAVGEYQKAVDDLTQAIDLEEDWPEPRYQRGLAYIALEDSAAARADFDRALELEPDYIAAYFDRGILFYNLTQYTDALADLNRVIRAFPEEGAAYFWRGAVHAKLGNNEQAIADLENVFEYSIEADIRGAAEELLQELKGEKRPTS